MRQGILGAVGIVMIVAAPMPAQTPPPASLPQLPAATIPSQSPPGPPVFPGASEPIAPPLYPGPGGALYPPPPSPVGTVFVEAPPPPAMSSRVWVRTEYLGWWVKNAPMPVTLVATDANGNNTQQVLGSDVSYGLISGVRLGIGAWFDTNNNIGVESSFFTLGQSSRHLSASSDGNGNPTLSFPFYNQTPGSPGEYLLPISTPGQYAGTALISSSFTLWGAELNGAFCLLRDRGIELTVLAGFRYADLQENLNINSVSSTLDGTSAITILNDSFNTRNQFYGGQAGTRFSWTGFRFGVDVTAKLALGSTHETVDIQGYSTQLGTQTANGTYPGGLYAQPSNSGRWTANQFTVMPSVEVKLSYFLSPRWRVFLGYDFMYWNQVVRPGSQIDRNVNLSQSSIYGNGTLTGPAYPMPLLNRTDFWAQGINVGLEFRF